MRVHRRRGRARLEACLAKRPLDAIAVEGGGGALDEEAGRHRLQHPFEREELAIEVALAEGW